jgi:chromosome segregation ATPase
MSESAASRRIVPDVEQSVSAQHLRYRKGPAIWPIWLVLMVISGLLAAAAAALWYERERLLDEVSGLSGEVSNMHARLDSGDTQIEEAITLLQAQMGTLFQEQDQLGMAFNDTRRELFSLIPASEDTVSADTLDELMEQISSQQQAAAERDRQLSELGASLETLEQASTQARRELTDEIARLITQLERQETEVLEDMEALRAEQQALHGRIQDLDGSVDEVIAGNSADTVSHAEMTEQIAVAQQNWQEELNALESNLRQIRQAQLAFSAQLEMLR